MDKPSPTESAPLIYHPSRLDTFTLALVAATVSSKGIGAISLAGIRDAKALAERVIANLDGK